MRRIIAALPVIIIVVITSFASCYKKDINTTNCNYDPCATKAPASEITQLEAYLSGAGIVTAIKHCSGMYYEIIVPGAGESANTCSYVNVNYKGSLTNGQVFDQTTTAPAGFPLVTLIEGWKKGIPLIKTGGKIRLYIPPSLGYGAVDQKDATGTTVIPANSILIYDIELVDVQ